MAASNSENTEGAPLQMAPATFAGFLEAAPDAVVIVDREGTIVLVNGQTERLFGYSRADLIGQPVETLVPARFRSAHPAHRLGYWNVSSPRAMGSGLQLHALRRDGTEFPVEISLSPLETDQGKMISSTIRDITDRQHAEEQVFRLAAIVNSSNDAIIGKTLQGVITSWNDGARRLFGYRADEIVGRSITVLIPEERAAEEPEILRRIGAGEHLHPFDTVRRRKDGSLVHVSVTSSAVRDARGRILGVSKVARDITERKQAELALARAKESAEASNRELEAFSYSVAHDLRAPLRGMNGFAQVLLDTYRDKLDANGQDWLREILANARKMGALIDALLSLARLSSRQPRHEWVNLSAVVKASAAQLAAAEPERAVELVVQEGLGADLDPALARALIDNLLGNAWKFTSKVAHARVEFGQVDHDGLRAFFVRDNGAGFDMAFAQKLFGAFQRLHSVDEFPGTGIGLATVQRVVHRHGGRVWAEGAVDAGATFFFMFSSPGVAP